MKFLRKSEKYFYQGVESHNVYTGVIWDPSDSEARCNDSIWNFDLKILLMNILLYYSIVF